MTQPKASQLEVQNLQKFGKNIIPTANFGVFKNISESNKFLESCNFPIVIKADGLASGKGVYICKKRKDAKIACEEIFSGKFWKADNILFEEFLDGEEMSFFIISDGETFYNLVQPKIIKSS